jgi:GNAT superfamily N-acetyltransferase
MFKSPACRAFYFLKHSHNAVNMTNDISPEIISLDLKDIPHLIDCVRRCYGDSYPFSAIYDVDKLSDLLKTKLMHSVIAKLSSGEVIGHCALTFEDPQNTTPELGKLLVDPAYRGHGIAEKLVKQCIEIATTFRMPGFWAECVTNHPHRQHELIVFDAKETGLFIGDIPSTIAMQGLQNFVDTRMSLLTYYLPLIDLPHSIYLPIQHQEHIKALAQELNLKRILINSQERGKGKTVLNTVVNSSIQTANIAIQVIGDDLTTAVINELKSMESLKLASVYLDLPIEQEAAARTYTELEDLGFFWGSWLPNYTKHKDILRLQKIYQSVNVNEIICAREQGEEVKKYVVTEWERVSSKN